MGKREGGKEKGEEERQRETEKGYINFLRNSGF